jgi:hypothetical protein
MVTVSWHGPTRERRGQRLPLFWVEFTRPGERVAADGHVLYMPGKAGLLGGGLTPLELSVWPGWFSQWLDLAPGPAEVEHGALVCETPVGFLGGARTGGAGGVPGSRHGRWARWCLARRSRRWKWTRRRELSGCWREARMPGTSCRPAANITASRATCSSWVTPRCGRRCGPRRPAGRAGGLRLDARVDRPGHGGVGRLTGRAR